MTVAMQRLVVDKIRLPGFGGKWTTRRLGDLADIDPENLPANTDPDHEFNYISLEQVEAGRLRGYTVEIFRTSPSRARRRLRRDDVLMSTVRPNLMGHLFFNFNNEQFANTVCSTGFAVLRCKRNLSVPGFLFAHLFGPVVNKQIDRTLAGSNYPAISSQDVALIEIPCPSIREQTAIAAVLSDVDRLLESLESLIAKKRAVKTAAMQQLLTGQTRLPGFSEEWSPENFTDLLTHHSGNTSLIKGKLSDIPQPGYFPAYSASGQDIWHETFEYQGEALIVSAVGSRCGKTFKASDRWSAIANTHVVWPNSEKIDIGFLHLHLDENFWLKSGTGQPFVMFKHSFSRTVFLPELSEQMAIAAVLSDMDAEIAALERCRTKTRALKQGMMQQLLTGKIQLVDPA